MSDPSALMRRRVFVGSVMSLHRLRRSAAAVWLCGLTAVAPAAAGGPTGRWDREDGLGGIDITPCGDALCARISWLRDAGTPAHVDQQVLFDMRRSAEDTWSGSAFNPEDGRTYAGTMILAGNKLVTRGCILAGLLCRTVILVRPR